MATTTPNLGLLKPVVGADADAWGTQLNASLDTLDAKVLDKTTGGTVSGAVNVIAATTAPAVRITQTGTGEALRVEDEANPDATPFVIDAAGNVGVGTGASYSKLYLKQLGNASITTGFVVENSTNDNRLGMYFDGPADEWRVIASFGTTGAFKPLTFYTSDLKRLTIDPAGNLGLGVTPSAWGAGLTSLDLKSEAFVSGGGSYLSLLSNVYFNSGARYKANNFASEYLQQNGVHTWKTAPSGTAGAPITFTQAMTLTQGGNLLVGTTVESNSARLNLSAATNAVDDYTLTLGFNIGASYSPMGAIGTHNDNATSGGLVLSTINNGTMAERARITSAGYLKASNTGVYGNTAGLGDLTNNPTHIFQSNTGITQSNINSAATSFNYASYLPSGSTGGHILGYVNNVETYRINPNGSGGQVSDANLKTDIVEATPKLADLNRVRIVNYRWKEESGISDRKEIGVIAQELEQVFPGLVDTIEREDGTEQKMVRYSVFVPILVKAVQELSAQNAALESRLAALEAK